MDRSNSELIEQSCQRWEAQRQAAARQDLSSHVPRAFTIAVSREVGTRGSSVAEEVGKLLNWHVYDRDLLENIAHEMGLRRAYSKASTRDSKLGCGGASKPGWRLSRRAAKPLGPTKPRSSTIWSKPSSHSAFMANLWSWVGARRSSCPPNPPYESASSPRFGIESWRCANRGASPHAKRHT